MILVLSKAISEAKTLGGIIDRIHLSPPECVTLLNEMLHRENKSQLKHINVMKRDVTLEGDAAVFVPFIITAWNNLDDENKESFITSWAAGDVEVQYTEVKLMCVIPPSLPVLE